MIEPLDPSLPLSSNTPQLREVVLSDFTSDVYLGFNTTITGDITATANMLTLWSPSPGYKFQIRGYQILVTCTVTCNDASNAYAHLLLFDNANTVTVEALGMYDSNATAAGDIVVGSAWIVSTRWYATPYARDLGRGYLSRAAGNKLYLGGTHGLTDGVLRCSGSVWGVEVK